MREEWRWDRKGTAIVRSHRLILFSILRPGFTRRSAVLLILVMSHNQVAILRLTAGECKTLNALFDVAYDRDHLKSRPQLGNFWAIY